jgi:TonB-linked SusC/RagA family outer membrane protein
MKKLLLILLLASINAVVSFAQTITVSGVVTDSKNEPLIGVNVVVKDQPGFGAITDINGHYELKNVQTYDVLVFSYVGFDKKTIPVKGNKTINVKMEESKDNVLNEVVVTGTGSRKKINVTGAVTSVDVEELKSNPTGNISNALAGVVPGIQAMSSSGRPGSVSEFWVRSISTFGANSSALVLVDGFERNLDEINVEDIESFSVLKDASETAIYGSKGANGVILITTRHGKDSKININAKVEGFYNTFTKTPEFADGYTYAKMANEARITRNQDALYSDPELEMFRLKIDPDLYPNVNWMDLILRDGAWSERASLNMNGGGRTARYYVSGSYINQQGMYKTDKSMSDYNTNANYHKWNYRMNLDIDVTRTSLLKLGLSGSLAKVNDTGRGSTAVWTSLMGYNPTMTPVLYSNGYVPAWGDADGFNPWVQSTQTGYRESWTNNIQATLEFDQNLDMITKGLKFTFRFGYDTYNSNYITRTKWPAQYKATPRYRDANGDLVFTRVAAEQQMAQTSGSDGSRNEFIEWFFNYNRTFFKTHHVGATLKYNQQSKVQTQNLGTDLKNGLPRRNQGLAGRVEYNWNYRYYINFNFGYTGSENFHKDHRFGFFPAVSAAWNVAEEPFVKKHMPWIDMFKVRYSWGKTGNDNLGTRFPYLYTLAETSGNVYEFGDYGYSRLYKGLSYTVLASQNVTWEISTKRDLGFDFSFFNDKVNGSFDLYNENRSGIYMVRQYLPLLVGVTSNPSANVGKVKAHGFDGNIAVKQRISQVDLTLRGNITYGKNKILERDEENTIYSYKLWKGHRVNQCFGLIAEGLFKDYDDIRNHATQTFGDVMPGDIKYKDVNGDGVVNSDDVVAIGATRTPNLTYGFGVSAKWKGFDFNVHFQGAGKSTFFIDGTTVYMFSSGNGWGNIMKEMAEGSRWISSDISGDKATENVNADYPRLTYGDNANNNRASTFWLRNGSYIRLKTLDFGYTLPKTMLRKLHCNSIRISFVGTNLLTFSKFKLWDPELASSTGKEYPLSKTYSLALSINL